MKKIYRLNIPQHMTRQFPLYFSSKPSKMDAIAALAELRGLRHPYYYLDAAEIDEAIAILENSEFPMLKDGETWATAQPVMTLSSIDLLEIPCYDGLTTELENSL